MLLIIIPAAVVIVLVYSLVKIGGDSDQDMHKIMDKEIAKKRKPINTSKRKTLICLSPNTWE